MEEEVEFSLNFDFDKAAWKDFYTSEDDPLNTLWLDVGDFVDSEGDEYFVGFYHHIKENTFGWVVIYEGDCFWDGDSDFINIDSLDFEKARKYMQRIEKESR